MLNHQHVSTALKSLYIRNISPGENCFSRLRN